MVLLPKKTRGGTIEALVTLRFGDDKALFGKGTAGQFAVGFLVRGTRNRTREQVQEELDRLKARLTINGSATNVTASIQTVEANLPAVLCLAAEILREPSYPEGVRADTATRDRRCRGQPQRFRTAVGVSAGNALQSVSTFLTVAGVSATKSP